MNKRLGGIYELDCDECGYTWWTDDDGEACPNCGGNGNTTIITDNS